MLLHGIEKTSFIFKILFKMKKNKIIYSLNVTDVQNVANQELERNLSSDEIRQIIETIEKKINWYDAISDAITEKLIQVSVTNA